MRYLVIVSNKVKLNQQQKQQEYEEIIRNNNINTYNFLKI